MNWLIFSLMTGALLWPIWHLPAQRPNFHEGSFAGSVQGIPFCRGRLFRYSGIGSFDTIKVQGATLNFPAKGMGLSFIAGLLGAVGAFCILLAFGAKGTPAAVMSIVFAGAPVVNAIVSMSLHPPKGGVSAIPWQFVLGILLAALGGCLVTMYKPVPAAAAKANTPPAKIAKAE